MNEIEELKRQGLSVCAIAAVMGLDRKTVRKYLANPERQPRYGPRRQRMSGLEPFKAYIDERLVQGVWNAVVLLRELRERSYKGGYTALKEYLQPKREEARAAAVRRFETPPGRQAQVDWGHLGTIDVEGRERKVWGFTFTLGYSRMMMAEAALEQTLPVLVRMHEEAFRQLGGVPEEILYDRMRTVWTGLDERGEVIWHPMFLDFARYWGFTPRLCRPYRAQTKGKVESGIKYVRRNFLCGLLGREPSGLEDLNSQLRSWVWSIANQRVHGTTHEQPVARWRTEQQQLQPIGTRPPYPCADDQLRRVARDAYVAWDAARYSVPWQYAGRDVWVREKAEQIEIHCGSEKIAVHDRVARHRVVTNADHHRGIPLGGDRHSGKTVVQIRSSAPMVETRPLAAYESIAMGGRL